LISHTLLTVFFWNAGFYGRLQNKIYSQLTPDQEPKEKSVYEKLGIEQRLLEELDHRQAYLDKDLTLLKLALLIGTNRTYLSRYINQELNTNFNDLVNEKRVNYAFKLLSDDGKKLNEICELSGFNSMSSFYRAFKKFRGYTFSKRKMAN